MMPNNAANLEYGTIQVGAIYMGCVKEEGFLAGKEILIVEDSPTQSKNLRNILEKHLYRVSIAANGRDALDKISREIPALVISDIIMPVMDGFELCSRIKADVRTRDIPVILLTSLSDPMDVIRGLECSADNFFTKPCDESYLISRIEYVLAYMNLREQEQTQLGVEVVLKGAKYHIKSDRIQILNLLLSSYETAIQKSREFLKMRDELYEANKQLKKVNDTLHAEISERKQIGDSLRESEERFRALLTASSDTIYRMSPDWSEMSQLRGRNFLAGTEAPSRTWLQKYIHPDDQPHIIAAINETIRTKSIFELEHRVLRVDGSLGWAFSRAIPIQDVNGEIVEWFGSASDITGRKDAEDTIRYSEEQYRSLVNTLIEGFCTIEMIFDADGRPVDYCFLEVNPAFEKQTGLHDVQGRLMSDLAPDNESHWFEIYGKVALAGEPVRFENEAKALGHHYDVCAFRIGGPESRKVGILFNDITKRKRAEEALRGAHDDLENRVHDRTSDLAATVVTLRDEIAEREQAEASLSRLNRLYAVRSEIDQAIIRSSNRESMFLDFCQIAVEQGGFLLAWVGVVDGESGQVRRVAAWGATGYLDNIRITTGEEPAGLGPTAISIHNETYYICNDFLNDPITRPWQERGRIYGIRASASVVVKEEGRVIGTLTLYAGEKDFFDDKHVTLLVQMGADISFALDNLARETRRREAEQELRDETLERLRAVEELREKEQLLIQQSRLAALGEMIGNIAHQWRQPLNTLGLLVQQAPLFYKFGEVDGDFLKNNAKKSMEVIQHMSQTIDDFRNFFKTDKEKVVFKVKDEVAKTLSLMEGSLHRIDIEVEAKEDPAIEGFPNEFSQVLLNILNNARDALSGLEIALPKVLITIGKEENWAVITIADNAGGIPEEIIGKIFDPYFTTKGPQAGTGVGLFMSKIIIEQNMGGSLTVRNIADGAEFRIEV